MALEFVADPLTGDHSQNFKVWYFEEVGVVLEEDGYIYYWYIFRIYVFRIVIME